MLRDTTSRGLCVRVWPPHTSDFPSCLIRPGRRLPVQGLSEGSLGFLDSDRLPSSSSGSTLVFVTFIFTGTGTPSDSDSEGRPLGHDLA